MTGLARATTRGRTHLPSGLRVLRRAWAGVLFPVVLVVLVFVAAGPASAHGGPVGDEPSATNWRSRITRFDSPDPGITITMIDAGEKVQLTNQSDQTVTVIGYQNEPYLRVGPDGVFENRRSPARYLNVSIAGGAPVPTTADAEAAPEWQRVTASNRVSWHDHRSHWMGGDPPPAVQSDAGTERVVIERWVIPIEVGDQRSDVIGDLTWVPAPPSWPWILAIAVLSTGIGAAAFTPRWKPVIWVGAITLLASCGIDIVGTWWGSTDPVLQKAAALITPSLSFAFLIAGLLFLDKRREDGLLLIFGGSAGVAVFFGWTSRGFLTNSQIAIALTPSLARLTVTLALGVGLGLMLIVLGLNRASLAALLPGWSTQGRGATRKGIPTKPAR